MIAKGSLGWKTNKEIQQCHSEDLQTKINPKVEEEGKFYNALQRKIDYNRGKARKASQEGRK